ncbi:MAG: PAS domain S-box protein, partial [Anaerolineales bacterium]|nr:PAS domain S-box protein [Anaerolineales bacterium]
MTDKIPTPGSTEKDKKQAAKRRLSSNPSAAEWQATFDAVNSAIFITDKDCTIVQCNRTTEELFQRPAAEILGKKCYHLVYGADAPISACPLDVTQRTKHRHMLTFKQNDRWFELSVDPILDHAGKCIGSVHVINDITERKQAEQLVQEKEKAYRALFEQTNDAIFIISLEGIHLKVNPRVSEFLGYPTEEIVGRPVVDFIAPEERQDSMEKRFRLLAGEHLPVYERVFMRKDGTRVWGEVNVALVYDEQGKPSHIHSIVRDITERKLAEERLRQSEEKYRDLFQNAPVGLFRSRISDGKILESNDYIAHMFGYASREEFIAEHITAKHYVDPGTRERLLELLYQNGVVENFEARMRRKDGSIFWARFYDRIYPEQGWIEGVVQDITEQKEAQERLRQSEETYRNLFHNAQVGLFRTRISDGKILESNDQLAHMFGYSGRSEFVNQFSTQEHYVDPGTRERMLELIRRDGFIKNFEARFYRKDGSIFWARYSARIYPEQGWIEGVVEDITDQKRAEEEIHRLNAELEARIEERTRQLKEAQEQLVRQEKLAVLGQLAGGVGHELRNPLAVISNAVYFLKLILPEADEKVREYLDILERETRNAEKIISDLLD